MTLLAKLLIVIAGLILASAVYLFLSIIFPAMLAIICVGGYYLFKLQNVEYEYAFTDGDFDVDKITGKRRRKQMLATNTKMIQVMAPYTKEFESEVRDYQVVAQKDFSSSKNAAGRWFMIIENDEGKYEFVAFQPSPRMRRAMKPYLRMRMKGDVE